MPSGFEFVVYSKSPAGGGSGNGSWGNDGYPTGLVPYAKFSIQDRDSVSYTIEDKSTNTIPITVTTGDVADHIYPNWDTMVGSGISYDPATHEITKNSAGWNGLLLDSNSFSWNEGKSLQWEVDTSWGGYTVGFRDTTNQAITAWDYWLYCGGTSCQFYYNSYNYGNTDEYPTPSGPSSGNYNYDMSGFVDGDIVKLEMDSNGEVTGSLNGVVKGTFGGSNAPGQAQGSTYYAYALAFPAGTYGSPFTPNIIVDSTHK